MKTKISALMDGELLDVEMKAPLSALKDDAEALHTWREYHLIGDALRGTPCMPNGFSTRFAARLAQEPTVLAPARIPKRATPRTTWIAMSAAAGVAAVSLVGWLAFAPQPDAVPTLAQVNSKSPTLRTESTLVPMPREANDYLLAHQVYSPRGNLQGVAPYVRTVSDSSRPR